MNYSLSHCDVYLDEQYEYEYRLKVIKILELDTLIEAEVSNQQADLKKNKGT